MLSGSVLLKWCNKTHIYDKQECILVFGLKVNFEIIPNGIHLNVPKPLLNWLLKVEIQH